jgi:hypothetical protein
MRPHLSVAHGRKLAGVALMGLLVLGLAAPANAVPIDDVVLHGPEDADWYAEGDYTYGTSGGPCTGPDGGTQEEGFSGADEGDRDGGSDAFDGGLYVMVNGNAFGDGVENGRRSGQTLKVGPKRMSGVRVTVIERALQSSPTMRSLVKFQNRQERGRTLSIVWDSGLGSDDSEETRGSSAGPALAHTRADRWIISSDSATDPPGDPALLFAYFGRGAGERVTRVLFAPEDPDPANGIGSGCVAVRYRITIPANSTRYMLFFTDMWETNAEAFTKTGKYNQRHLGPNLLNGLGPAVRQRVVNWDLG